jgi:hypothetical protein
MTPRWRSSAVSRETRLTPPADLEGPYGLVILMLDEDLGADQVVQGRVAKQRRRPQMRRDATARLEHVGERWDLPFHRAPDRSEALTSARRRPQGPHTDAGTHTGDPRARTHPWRLVAPGVSRALRRTTSIDINAG